MNELIKIGQGQIGGEVVQTVNARDLHEFLESKRKFSDWIKERIDLYDFTEGVDFVCHRIVTQYNQVDRIDYSISIDMAKEISMVERNHKGKEARQYFIDCERKVKLLTQPAIPQTFPEALKLAYEQAVQIEQQSIKLLEQQPKVESFDALMESKGNYTVRSAANVLRIGPNHLFEILRREGVFLGLKQGRNHPNWNTPAQIYQDKGYFIVKTGTLRHNKQPFNQSYVTPKGLDWLSKKLVDWNEFAYLKAA